MKIVLAAAVMAAAAGVVAQPVSAKGLESSFQIDAAHDGQIRFESPFQAPLRKKWVATLGSTLSFPVYGNGNVFVRAYTESGPVLFALDARKGKIVWQQSITGGVPVYDNGRVYLVTFGGLLQAYNAKTGTLEWSQQQADQYAFEDPPTAVGGSVYLTGAGSGVTLYAAKEKKGNPLWSQGGPAGDSMPAVGGGNVYVTYPCNDYAFKQKGGASQWSYNTGCDGGGGGTPVYFDNRVYINDSSDNVVLDATTGAYVRDFPAPEFVPAFWTPVSGNPLGLVVAGDGTLSAFDPTTGNSAWSVQPESFSTPPLVINDTVLLGDFYGGLHAFNPQTGAEIWSTTVSGSSIGPALGAGGGMLFVPEGSQLSGWVPK